MVGAASRSAARAPRNSRTSAVDTDEQVSQHVDKCGPIHGKSPVMPYLAQLTQDADLRVGGEASKMVRLLI
jgi:hypothetical protein